MKFCYVDESGIGEEPYAVMVGVIVDSVRMAVTKKDWAGLLKTLSSMVGKPLQEIHTKDFYAGNGVWRKLDGKLRARIVDAVFEWFRLRKHDIVYSSVDKAKFMSVFKEEPQAKDFEGSLWRFMALHICLALQKYHQTQEKPKGHTVMIFDNEEKEIDFVKCVKLPFDWTDTYYDRGNKQDRLDQIIDVPYFGDSRYVDLIQLADFISFFLRKYVEIKQGVKQAGYPDEPGQVEKWANVALAQAIPKPMLFPSRGRCECADLFYRYAPPCLL